MKKSLVVMCTVLALAGVASAQEKFAPTELNLKTWLADSSKTLWATTSPDPRLVGTEYFGLVREGKPVGYEIYTTTVADRMGRRVYRLDDRAHVLTPQAAVVTVQALGFADPAFSGLEATLNFTMKEKNQSTTSAIKADRLGKLVKVESTEGGQTSKDSVQVDEQVVALTGEIERLVRLHPWKTGEILALWHLDMVNLRMGPVVLRALRNDEAELSGRKLGRVKVEAYFFGPDQADKQFLMELQYTTYFDPAGKVALIQKTDGLTKLLLTEEAFKKDWEPSFLETR